MKPTSFQKKEQRRQGRRIRAAINDRDKKSAKIAEHLFQFKPLMQAVNVNVFISFGTECDTIGIIKSLLEGGWKVSVPVVGKPPDNRLIMTKLDKWDKSLFSLSSFGILEPNPGNCTIINEAEIDLVVVPGLLFDRAGGRVGYGGGYYDRMLADYKTGGKKTVALAFSEQLIDRVFVEPHDIMMDHIISDTEIITCNKNL